MNYRVLVNSLDEYCFQKEELDGETIFYVYPKNNEGSANLDVGIKLENTKGTQIWCLYEIPRNKNYKLDNFSTKEIGLLALYIAVKGKFEKVKGYNLVKSELRKVEKNLVDVKAILQKNIKEVNFSL
ncbi:hypothetical protein [Metabacillus halosaccharovorans]|uniref:hypothetical protein n=1 Tax=Metabacillus halosaccharovorans TaxID=930124 RepID=UPI00203F1C09|nr:hypothetical protein [Metabacillus halosaccharovorans]MCM3441608.1 hypothetical protein [Metabacillus halosaccharovorans]